MKTWCKLNIFVFTWLALAVGAYAADESPLFDAIRKGNKAVLEELLAKGADVNAKGIYGRTPLYAAVSSGLKDIAELLLAKGADINAQNENGMTPLHMAVDAGKNDAVEFLLANGADINIKNDQGETALTRRVVLSHTADYSSTVEFIEDLFLKRAKNPRELFGQIAKQLESQNIKRPNSLILPIPDNGPRQAREIQMPVADFVRNFAIRQNDISARRLIIKLASRLTPAPAIPEEARKHFIEGTAIVKAAKNPAQQALAAQSFSEALKIAPWWSDAYYNLGVAQDLAEKYDEAEMAFNFYLVSNASDAEKRDVQDRIYGLSAKRKLGGAK